MNFKIGEINVLPWLTEYNLQLVPQYGSEGFTCVNGDTEKHYEAVFTEADHYRLNTVLKGLKGRFILSYNDDDFIRKLYEEYKVIPVERQNNLSSGRFRELIIKNF